MSGEIDVGNLATLVRALRWAVRVSGQDIRLDLAGLTFIDVAGLRFIVAVAAGLPPGRSIVLDAVPPHVRRLMTLVGWDRAPGLAFTGADPDRPGSRPTEPTT
ncbi:STAS domain-containing protein [Nonomuraea sp. NN258]|nr:STAS domain-containing protein [Nonomuraea antri]